MNGTRWSGENDANDSIKAELGRALDEARARLPDDVKLRRMWARAAQLDVGAREAFEGVAFEGDEGHMPTRRSRAPRWLGFVTGMASTAALAVACAVWLWPRHPSAPTVVAVRPVPAPERV